MTHQDQLLFASPFKPFWSESDANDHANPTRGSAKLIGVDHQTQKNWAEEVFHLHHSCTDAFLLR